MTGAWDADQIKEHIEAILIEKDRALSMADGEREKAASALRGEQQRALDQADSERHRAAEKLRAELARQIDEGDDRLREHITQQFQQISAALVSSEKLEIERFSATKTEVRALKEQLEVLRAAAIVAQDKFEHSVESRFQQVNEFRGSLDDLGKTMATRRELEALGTSANAKVDELASNNAAKHDELSKQLVELRSRLDVGPAALASLQTRTDLGEGRAQGAKQNQVALYAFIAAVAAFVGIIIVIANAWPGP